MFWVLPHSKDHCRLLFVCHDLNKVKKKYESSKRNKYDFVVKTVYLQSVSFYSTCHCSKSKLFFVSRLLWIYKFYFDLSKKILTLYSRSIFFKTNQKIHSTWKFWFEDTLSTWKNDKHQIHHHNSLWPIWCQLFLQLKKKTVCFGVIEACQVWAKH